jgi:hypothetical protein
LRIDFDDMVYLPLLDEASGAYVDSDALPLSETSRRLLRDLQARWSAADERWSAGEEPDAEAERVFAADVKAVELRVRRELAGTEWSLVLTAKGRKQRRGHGR